jgi:hypothetical protein
MDLIDIWLGAEVNKFSERTKIAKYPVEGEFSQNLTLFKVNKIEYAKYMI